MSVRWPCLFKTMFLVTLPEVCSSANRTKLVALSTFMVLIGSSEKYLIINSHILIKLCNCT